MISSSYLSTVGKSGEKNSMAHTIECDKGESFFSENAGRQETLCNRLLQNAYQTNISQPLAQLRPQQTFQPASPVEIQRGEIPLHENTSQKNGSLSSSTFMIKLNTTLSLHTPKEKQQVIKTTTQKQQPQKKTSVERKNKSFSHSSDTLSNFPCRESSALQLSSPTRGRSPKTDSTSTSESPRTMYNSYSISNKKKDTEVAHITNSQYLSFDESESERALNVLYPKVITSMASLANHVHRLEEAYLCLLRVHKKEPLHVLPPSKIGDEVNDRPPWENRTIIAYDAPHTGQNARRSACGHASHVTLREVTLLRASLEATKCVAQEWVSDRGKENKDMNKDISLTQDESNEKISQDSNEIFQRKRRNTLPQILLQSSSLSPDSAPCSREEVQQIEASLESIEEMAAEIENAFGETMVAPVREPALDTELPAVNDANYITTGSATESALSRIKTRWRKWRLDKNEEKMGNDKEESKISEKLVLNNRISPVDAPSFPSQKKAYFYGSPISTDSSRRGALGVPPSTPSSAPLRFYWWTVLNTSWERLMQVLTVGFFNFFVCCPLCFLFTLVLVFFFSWKIRFFTLLYFIYIFSPLGKPKFPVSANRWYQSLSLWKFFRDYFPVRQIIPPEVQKQFDPRKNYLFCYHPHATHAFGAIATFGGESNGLSSYLSGLQFHLQTLSINFFIPFWRQLCMLVGLGDASSTCIRATLRSGPGQCVALVVGGAEESILSRPRTNDLVLKKRKGFVKIALETGSSLVPVYGFGETNSYESLSCVNHPTYHSWEQIIKRYTKITLPGIAGRGPFGVWPLRRPIFVVIGAPIEVPKIPSPTEANIEFYHQKYMTNLLALYDEYCGVYNVGCRRIRILQ